MVLLKKSSVLTPQLYMARSVLGTERGASDLTLSRVEHEGLVEVTESVNFQFSCLQPSLNLLLNGLKVPDMNGS